MAVNFSKFNAFIADVYNGVHDFSSDSFKLVLTNTAPTSSDSVLADITQISAGNGYTAGGNAMVVVSSTQTSGTYSLVGTDVTFTASGGSIADFRYAVLYNDTSASDSLVGYYDNGSTVSLSDTETFTWDTGATVFIAS